MSYQTVLKPAMDAHVRSDRVDHNFGDATRLRAKSDARCYLWFDIDRAPGATLLSAVLELTSLGTGWTSQTVTVQQLTDKWSEGKVTWNNKPAAAATTLTSAAITGANQVMSLDVTTLVGVGSAWRGLDVRASGAADNRQFASSEYPDPAIRPRLILTWAEAAETPYNLRPTNDNAVATRSPKLTWEWGASNEDFDAVQVQLDLNGGNFSAPAYDSGMTVSTELAFTLPALTLPASGIRDWRARVRAFSGLIGPWSDPVGMQYVALPTLTITAPTASLTTDVPTVAWTFAGQTRAQVFVYDNAFPSDPPIHTSPMLTTATSYAIPDDVIVKSSGSYKFKVRAWDGVVREGVAGFPEYAEATLNATLSFSGAVAGVSTLTATQPTSAPFVRLTWTRGSAPDVYEIYVDSVKVLTLPGSTNTYDLWQGFTPGVQHLYEVMAGVGTPPVLSATNPDAFLTPRAPGAWFWRERDNASLQLLNESAAYAFADDTSFLQPVSQRFPIAISGDSHAATLDVTGVTKAKADRDLMEDFVSDDEPLRLLTGDVNALVQLTDLSIDPGPSGSWTVHVKATQVGA